MEDHKHLMASSTQEHVAEVDNYALALSEVSNPSFVLVNAAYVPDESIRQSGACGFE